MPCRKVSDFFFMAVTKVFSQLCLYLKNTNFHCQVLKPAAYPNRNIEENMLPPSLKPPSHCLIPFETAVQLLMESAAWFGLAAAGLSGAFCQTALQGTEEPGGGGRGPALHCTAQRRLARHRACALGDNSQCRGQPLPGADPRTDRPRHHVTGGKRWT